MQLPRFLLAPMLIIFVHLANAATIPPTLDELIACSQEIFENLSSSQLCAKEQEKFDSLSTWIHPAEGCSAQKELFTCVFDIIEAKCGQEELAILKKFNQTFGFEELFSNRLQSNQTLQSLMQEEAENEHLKTEVSIKLKPEDLNDIPECLDLYNFLM